MEASPSKRVQGAQTAVNSSCCIETGRNRLGNRSKEQNATCRLRTDAEREAVRAVLQDVLKVDLDPEHIYAPVENEDKGEERTWAGEEVEARRSMVASGLPGKHVKETDALKGSGIGKVVWTPTMRRMFALAGRCLHFSEPVLLVGETGTGKTTVCQLLAAQRGQRLRIVNCNQHTEAGDFLGGYRPVRDRESHVARLRSALEGISGSGVFAAGGGSVDVAALCALVGGELTKAVGQVAASARKAVEGREAEEEARALLECVKLMEESAGKARAPFEWVDGPLVQAMRAGDMILIDEFNLVSTVRWMGCYARACFPLPDSARPQRGLNAG